jgi:hypothetical protein
MADGTDIGVKWSGGAMIFYCKSTGSNLLTIDSDGFHFHAAVTGIDDILTTTTAGA